jgi:hypothetical protein
MVGSTRTHYLMRRTPRVTPHPKQDSHTRWWCNNLAENNSQSISCWLGRWDCWWHAHRQVQTKDHNKEDQRQKNRRECFEAMRRLPVRKVAQNIKNPTLALLPPILTIGGDDGSQYRIEPSGGATQFIGEKHKVTMLHIWTWYFHTWLIVHLFYQEKQTLFKSRRIQIMMHHHLRGSSWQHPLEDVVEEGVGSIIYPRGKAPLLYNQVVSPPHPIPMDTLNTLLQTHPQSSTMCNECMSGWV